MNGLHLHTEEEEEEESERERDGEGDLKSEGQNEVIYLLMRPFLMRARTHSRERITCHIARVRQSPADT